MKRIGFALAVILAALACSHPIHEAMVVETESKTYAQFVRLIKRPAAGEKVWTPAGSDAEQPTETLDPRARQMRARLEGRALIELFGDDGIAEITAAGDLSDREIYEAVQASKMTTENLLLRFHVTPRGQLVVRTAASKRFLVLLFHGAPIGNVRGNDGPEHWFWLKNNP